MAFNPDDVPPELIAAVKRREVVPLVGSGLSKQASAEFPNWRELLTDLLERANDEGYIGPDDRLEVEGLIAKDRYLTAAEHLSSLFPGDAYVRFLEDKFSSTGIEPSQAHRLLWQLRPSLVMTTNFDRLLENSYAREFHEVPTVMTYRQADAMQRAIQAGRLSLDIPMIFKLHGSIDIPTELILTERQFRELVYRQPGYRIVLSALFVARVILMIGFSADDPELRLLLETHREALKYLTSPDYALLPMPAGSVTARRLREDFGVQVIPYEPADPTHPEVVEFLQYLVAELNGA